MQPWALGGGPDEPTLRRHIEEEGLSDSEIARIYGVRRQTATYWRLKIGISTPGPGVTRHPRRPRYSHKELVPWKTASPYLNDPIRRRLVEISLVRQGAPVSPDVEGRAQEFLDFLRRNDVVVTYDPEHRDHNGDPAPFYFVPRDPEIDADDDLVRRPD